MSPFSRRDFLVTGAAAGAGLIVGFALPHGAGLSGSLSGAFAPSAYLQVPPEGKVKIVVPRSEMGQGVRTALPMILAEELEVDLSQIEIEQAGASTLFGDQTTGGSASIRTTWDPMRRAGASAREMLITAAALEWGVPRGSCHAEKGAVVHADSKRQLTYGQLAARAATLPIPTDPPLKAAKDYKIVGKPVPRVDTSDKVQGKAIYGIDFRLPNMKYAVLARCPVFGGKVASFDDKDARKVAGVTQVVKVSDTAVAVISDTVWGAIDGRRALNVTWDEGPNKHYSSATAHEAMKDAAGKKAAPIYTFGEPATVGGRRVEAVYELPMLAHAPMEPGNTVAHFQGDRCEIWSPTQVPQAVRDDSAKALGLDPDKVIVNVTLIGGGFGRRLESDYGVEAAVVSKAINGPVQVLWTREDDMRSSTYRPPSYHVMSAVLDGQGWPVSFQHRYVGPSMNFQKGGVDPSGLDSELKDEATFIYGVPHVNLEYVYVESPVPFGWMRSVYGQHAAFAQECFLDEIAGAAGKDPLALRLHLLEVDRENPPYRSDRLKGVLQLAAEKAGWGKPLPAGRFHGIAAHCCFNSYAAEVVEISMEGDKPRVHRVVAAIDCGQVINPNILDQQLQGGVTFALSNALRAKITVDKGRIVEGNFDDYEMLRMSEAPDVEAHFVESGEAPSGAGEPTVPPLAPALCNAMYAATKKRVRALPVLSS